jgi:hypothetical protein
MLKKHIVNLLHEVDENKKKMEQEKLLPPHSQQSGELNLENFVIGIQLTPVNTNSDNLYVML